MLKLPRSKKGSPMPAYSQSTMRMRSPSSMKLAFSRSSWQGLSSIGDSRKARSIRREFPVRGAPGGGVATGPFPGAPGTRSGAARSDAAGSPRSDSSSGMASPRTVCRTGREGPAPERRAARQTDWPFQGALGDDRLAGCEVRLHPVLATPLGHEVVDEANDHNQAHERLEDGPSGQAGEDVRLPIGVGAKCQEGIDEGVGPQVAQLVSEVPEDGAGPDADVDHHRRAPHEGQDVDDGPPAPEAEPSPSVRPTL